MNGDVHQYYVKNRTCSLAKDSSFTQTDKNMTLNGKEMFMKEELW